MTRILTATWGHVGVLGPHCQWGHSDLGDLQCFYLFACFFPLNFILFWNGEDYRCRGQILRDGEVNGIQMHDRKSKMNQ